MGYSTEFKGELRFTSPISSDALGHLNGFLGKDRRDIGLDGEEAIRGYGSYWYHIDYELLPDFSGITWNLAEKSYDMEHIANFLIDTMRQRYPDFGLTGKMLAQGEDIDDRWELLIGPDGRALRRNLPRPGRAIRCPHCEGKVYPDDAEEYAA